MKAVAVPYVIALILGVAVIGLVGYWFATSGGKFGGQSSKTICDNKFLQYCVINPDKVFADFVGAGNAKCSGLGSYTACSELLGATPGTVGGGTGKLAFGATCNPADDQCDTGDKLKCSTKSNKCLGTVGRTCTTNPDCFNICSGNPLACT